MKKSLINAAVLGFTIAVMAIFAEFLFFNAVEGSISTLLLRALVPIFSPPVWASFYLAGWDKLLLASPFLNAALYAGAFWAFSHLRQLATRSGSE